MKNYTHYIVFADLLKYPASNYALKAQECLAMLQKNYPEALEKANGVVYGLAASVYGINIYDCLEVAKHLHFGTVWVNEHGLLTSETPHGGFKQSGFGKDLSMYSFEEYTRIKHIYIDSTRQKKRSWHYTVFGDQ